MCEENHGLKVLNIENVRHPEILYHFDDFNAKDIVSTGTSVIIVGKDHLYEYDYSDIQNVHLIWSVKV